MSARGRRKTGGGIRQKFTILPSCTKRVVMQLARDMGIKVEDPDPNPDPDPDPNP